MIFCCPCNDQLRITLALAKCERFNWCGKPGLGIQSGQINHIIFLYPPASAPRQPTPIFSRMAKVVTLEELKKHTSKDSLYVLLHEKGKKRRSANEKKTLAPTNLQ
jgi:hypothetical protein